jgi:hypothetical protein
MWGQRSVTKDNGAMDYDRFHQGPMAFTLHLRKILEAQRKTLKHQIMTSGGTWPTINSDLVAMYSHAFSRFMKSIDFYKLQ